MTPAAVEMGEFPAVFYNVAKKSICKLLFRAGKRCQILPDTEHMSFSSLVFSPCLPLLALGVLILKDLFYKLQTSGVSKEKLFVRSAW